MRASPYSLRSVARLLGLAPSTVSRALRDDPRISEATRRRVQEAVRHLGDAALRGRGGGRAGLAVAAPPVDPGAEEVKPLGLVIANPVGGLQGDEFFRGVVEGVLAWASRAGRQLLIETVSGRRGSPLPALVAQRAVAGVLVGGVPIDEAWLQELASQPLPVVTIGRYTAQPQRFFAAIPDNRAGGYLAGAHLAAGRYDEWWYVGGDLAIPTFADRWAGMRQALGDRPVRCVTGGIDAEAGWRVAAAVADRVRQGVRPGVFAATDWLASGLLRGLRQLGVEVPRQAGVVGYSDLELAAHTTPRLTTVRVDRRQLAWLACQLLEGRMAGLLTHPVQAVLQPELVIRESTDGEGPGDAAEAERGAGPRVGRAG